MLFDLFTDNLTANPIQAIEQRTGYTALVFLTLSLAWHAAGLLGLEGTDPCRRKALGNYGFLYAALHVLVFVAVDYGLDWKRNAARWGRSSTFCSRAAAFLLLVPLAATSFDYWMKRLGRNWKRLHRLVYLIVPLVVLHFFLAQGQSAHADGDVAQPLMFAMLVGVLLLLRLGPARRAAAWARGRLQALSRRTTVK